LYAFGRLLPACHADRRQAYQHLKKLAWRYLLSSADILAASWLTGSQGEGLLLSITGSGCRVSNRMGGVGIMANEIDPQSLTKELEDGKVDGLRQAFTGLGLDERISLLDEIQSLNKQDRRADGNVAELKVWHEIPTTHDMLHDDHDGDSFDEEVPDDHVNTGINRNDHKGIFGGLFSARTLYSETYYPSTNSLRGDGTGIKTGEDSAIDIPALTAELEKGNGSALKEVFKGDGVDEKIKILDEVIRQNQKDMKADDKVAKLFATHAIPETQFSNWDPYINIQLGRSTHRGILGWFLGDQLYTEHYYPRSNRDQVETKDI
jgi:hypothetical protein